MPASLNLAYPFTGRWLTHSPANRVPSHGATRYAASYAIDFVPADDAGRTAHITLRTLIRPERKVSTFLGQLLIASVELGSSGGLLIQAAVRRGNWCV